MMTYFDGQQYDRHYYTHSHPGINAPAAYYWRSPYAYHHGPARYDFRPAYHDHPPHHTVIGEAEPQDQNDQQNRRRIAVAASLMHLRYVEF